MAAASWPHARAAAQVVADLQSDAVHGLTEEEARRRLARDGTNELAVAAPPGLLRLIVRQCQSGLFVVLLIAAIISAAVGDPKDSLVIVAVLVANATIGAVQEYRAERALTALRTLNPARAEVLRDSVAREVPAAELVAGDVVLVRAGDVVPADGRLLASESLLVDESALTGESVPSEKDARAELPAAAALGDRCTMVYMGTAATLGRGRLVVTATGSRTEVGRLAQTVREAAPPSTPLQRQFAWLTRVFSAAALAVSALVFAFGMLRHEPVIDTFIFAVSLAVAAVPEGLPAVQTIVLALGVQRMAKRRAIVRRLTSVEVLGATNTICTDKTGTLTLGMMRVTEVMVGTDSLVLPVLTDAATTDAGGASGAIPGLDQLLQVAVLCNDARAAPAPTGDPTEQALLLLAARFGLESESAQRRAPRVGEFAFSPERRLMTTLHRLLVNPDDPQHGFGHPPAVLACTKGAPEAVLSRCSHFLVGGQRVVLDATHRQQIEDRIHQWTTRGLRLLALASRQLTLPEDAPPDRGRSLKPDDVERDLTLLGLVGLLDPPRPEVPAALAQAQAAGVRTVMITGDHPTTAAAIAAQLGLDHGQVVTGAQLAQMDDQQLSAMADRVTVYARVSPEQKVRIVQALQRHGEVVAMTGDGANDAPALRLADIGIAMGIRGTAVAREAAAMVLTDDHYTTIVVAIKEGRTIYANLRKTVLYLLSGNLGEVLVIVLAMLLGLPLPLQPIHILWVNLVTDGLPAIGLGMEPPEPHSMARPPRRRGEVFLPRWLAPLIVLPSVALALTTLLAFGVVLARAPHDLAAAQSAAFATLVIGHLGLGWAHRATHASSLRLGPRSNPLLFAAVIVGAVAMVPLISTGAGQALFHTRALPVTFWLGIVILGAAPLLVAEAVKLRRRAASGA